jgi:high-affinity iron transporter
MKIALRFAPPLALFMALVLGASVAEAADGSARAVVHLLDYIRQDYGGAVADGRVISADEYAEMREFSAEVLRSAEETPELAADPRIGVQLRQLAQLVEQHASAGEVGRQALAIKTAILALTHLAPAPASWPSLERGQALYQTACAACHGPTGHGDGSAAGALEPPPANFHNEERMRTLAPFHAFNTIRLGLTGTAMPAFGSLSDDDTWALAFYVTSLRYASASPSTETPALSVAVAASESDEQLAGRIGGDPARQRDALAAIRLYSGNGEPEDTLATAEALLRRADTEYRAARYADARRAALSAYLEGIEPVEARLRAASPGTVAELERRMAAVRSAIERRQPAPDVTRAVDAATRTIRAARKRLETPATSPWFIFSVAAVIVLREAFEAVLIIVAILSVLRAVGARRPARWVHAGWMAAVALGGVAWLVSDSLLATSGMKRELLEAITTILAVVVLLYMGFWLHRRTEIARWKAFIEQQVTSTLTSGRLFGLAVIAFFAVFREAVETVLFLVALSLDAGPDGRQFIASGVLTSLACTLVLAWLLVRFSARLPLRTMFAVTAGLMMALSVVLAGKGLHALQEIGASSVTALPFVPHLDLVGIYPTLETLLAQTAIAVLSVVLWMRAQPRTRTT